MPMKELFPGVFEKNEKLFTVFNGRERLWEPYHSKASAAILKGLKNFPVKPGAKILYLGIADGNTASHFSDIIGEEGIIIGIDISASPFKKLLALCEERKNIIPVLADANKPEEYKEYVDEIGRVDVVYQDLAQKIQADILIKNAKLFLKKNGLAVYMVKALSIDVTEKPSVTFANEIKKLEKAGFEVLERVSLEPFERGHACLVVRLH
ncbi:MAG: fibrillarin-like rRNA/tRNA 2'-O-methyltransferase [archaeon]